MTEADLGDAVRLPYCFTCGRRLTLTRWRMGVWRCSACAQGQASRTVPIFCKGCGARLPPQRPWRYLLCWPCVIVYRRRVNVAFEARRRQGAAE